MNNNETKVHHAIIDLYEVGDEDCVRVSHIAEYTGMAMRDIKAAMNALEDQKVIVCTDGVVTEAKNEGYFPRSLPYWSRNRAVEPRRISNWEKVTTTHYERRQDAPEPNNGSCARMVVTKFGRHRCMHRMVECRECDALWCLLCDFGCAHEHERR